MDMRPTRRQKKLIDQARELAMECFAPPRGRIGP